MDRRPRVLSAAFRCQPANRIDCSCDIRSCLAASLWSEVGDTIQDIRTESHFNQIVGTNSSLERVLRAVMTATRKVQSS
jgi:hypothetical protein